MPFYSQLRNWAVMVMQKNQFSRWEKEGKPVPPPHLVKQRALLEYSKKYNLQILVETGTYYGDMVEAMKHDFDKIYSIELSRALFEKAQKRFKGMKHIELIWGDSGTELMSLTARLNQPTLFWLDGHYSAEETAKGDQETPVIGELQHILDAPDRGHVIIIDDARCFGTDPAYPTIEELTTFIKSSRPNVDISIQDDSIRITPK